MIAHCAQAFPHCYCVGCDVCGAKNDNEREGVRPCKHFVYLCSLCRASGKMEDVPSTLPVSADKIRALKREFDYWCVQRTATELVSPTRPQARRPPVGPGRESPRVLHPVLPASPPILRCVPRTSMGFCPLSLALRMIVCNRYPMDLRVSGKDLIANHLVMSLYVCGSRVLSLARMISGWSEAHGGTQSGCESGDPRFVVRRCDPVDHISCCSSGICAAALAAS